MNKLLFFCHVCHQWVMIKWFVFDFPCPWLLRLQWLFPIFSLPFWLIKVNKLFFFRHVYHEWVMIKWFVFSSPCPWLLQLWWLFPVFSSPFWLIKMNKLFFSVMFAMSGSSGLLLVVHVLDSWDYSLAASVFHGSLTLSVPRST